MEKTSINFIIAGYCNRTSFRIEAKAGYRLIPELIERCLMVKIETWHYNYNFNIQVVTKMYKPALIRYLNSKGLIGYDNYSLPQFQGYENKDYSLEGGNIELTEEKIKANRTIYL